MKKLFLLAALAILAAPLFAGTLLEQSKKGYDPYLADEDGFDSLFVNPAGIAGQSEYFSLSVEAGTWGALADYVFLRDNLDTITDLATSGGTMTQEEAAELLPEMLATLDNDTLLDFLSGTGITPAEVPTYDWSTLTPAQITAISSNMDDQSLQTDIMNQFQSISYNVEAEARVGTLINGFGFGIYANTYLLYSLGALGLEDMILETGAVAGYGFNIGQFDFGVSGKFALLTADNPDYPFMIAEGTLRDQQIIYGYAWGLDAGATWEPLEGLRFGVLFSDIIGSVTPVDEMAEGTIGDFLDGNIAGPTGGYAWNFDVSAGITWQPNWNGFQPKLSLDFHDIVGMSREFADENYSGIQDFYQKEASTFLRHMRVGANVKFFNFLDVGFSYYLEYFTLGAGLDFNFLELYAEVKTKQNFSDVGGNAMVKMKF